MSHQARHSRGGGGDGRNNFSCYFFSVEPINCVDPIHASTQILFNIDKEEKQGVCVCMYMCACVCQQNMSWGRDG